MYSSKQELPLDEEELSDTGWAMAVMSSPSASSSPSSQYDSETQEEEFESGCDATDSPANKMAEISCHQPKQCVRRCMDSITRLQRRVELTKESVEVLDRALDYMHLYVNRYLSEKFSTDWVRRMLFFARVHGAPLSRLRFPDPKKRDSLMAKNLLGPGFQCHWLSEAIDMEHFFTRMDYLESKYGERLWELHFIYGYENLNRPEGAFFRWQIISTVRSLCKGILRRNWAEVAQNISNIELTVSDQHNAKTYLSYLRNNLAPHIPGIFLSALQCSLETKRPIEEMSDQFVEICSAFRRLPTCKDYPWMDDSLLFLSNLLTFHLVNLRVKRRSEDGGDFLSSYIRGVRLHHNAERHRVIMLLSYCLEVERHLLTERKTQFQATHRSQSISFANFLRTLFDEPKSAIGLLPLAAWGAVQFGCEEELADYLLDACTKWPFLLIPSHNILSRFRLERISGRLFGRLFDLSLDCLVTSPVLLEILEQRSLDPASFGMFDSVISQNLKALFMFLDYGRHRTDIRAWALLHSNLCYLGSNEQLMMALLLPLWSKRKEWLRFHSVQLSSVDSEQMREKCLTILERCESYK